MSGRWGREKEDKRRARWPRKRERRRNRGESERKRTRRERERSGESSVFPGCSSRGGVKTLQLRQSRSHRSILRRCDSLRSAFLEASPRRKNQPEKEKTEARCTAIGPAILFLRFSRTFNRDQWHIRIRLERRSREIDKFHSENCSFVPDVASLTGTRPSVLRFTASSRKTIFYSITQLLG